MEGFCSYGCESTIERKQRVFRNPVFKELLEKKIIETTADDFLFAMRKRTTAVICYLKQIQNYAVDLGYLGNRILPSRRFPKPLKKMEKRAITKEEHLRYILAESNEERRAYYAMLWETGAAQTDGANLKAEDFDLSTNVLVYSRRKTNSICRLRFGGRVREILEGLPKSGYLFPKIREGNWRARAAEFRRRRRLLKIEGISLHSYRYSWAERALQAGIPERLAMVALGHGSKAIARAYAKSAEVVCPEII